MAERKKVHHQIKGKLFWLIQVLLIDQDGEKKHVEEKYYLR